MAVFLNRERIVEEIVNIINESRKEIIMVVPFIKISPAIWNELRKAENEGKEILLIYKESCLSDSERKKLNSLTNLTIINHPYVHAKCYLNESSLVICSMNLYEYSEKHNREMGILVNVYNDDEWIEDENIYIDCVKEIRQIKNASKLEKLSISMQKNGFKFYLLERKENLLKEYLDKVNKIFIHKNFEIISENEADPKITCFPYHENISATLEPFFIINETSYAVNINRIELKFHHSSLVTRDIHDLFWKKFPNKRFEQFKIYWDHYKRKLTIYPNRKQYPQWNEIEFDPTVKKLRQGLDLMIDYIKEIENKIQ